MRCSKTCVLIFSSLIMMTGGFVLTLSGWFAPAIREAVFRVRMAGPLILLIGFLLLMSACALCAYHQRRCCVCCYVQDKRKNVYPGPEYPFTEHMVELAGPPGMNTLSYEYQNEATDFGKTLSSEPVWHKKDSNALKATDDLSTSQTKPLLPHYSDAPPPTAWKLRGCRVQLKSVSPDTTDLHDSKDNRNDPMPSSARKQIAKPSHDIFSSAERPMQKLDLDVTLRSNASNLNRTAPQIKGILKTQSLDRCKHSVTSSLTHPAHTITEVTHSDGNLEANGITRNSNDVRFHPRPRPVSHSDHTNCPIVSTPPISARKQVILLPRPGSYRDVNAKTRPSPDRSPLLGLPKRGWTKPMATSIV